MDIFKKKRRRIIITGLAGVIAAGALFTGCNARETGFAGPDGRVGVNRETTAHNAGITDTLRDNFDNAVLGATTNHANTTNTTTAHTTNTTTVHAANTTSTVNANTNAANTTHTTNNATTTNHTASTR